MTLRVNFAFFTVPAKNINLIPQKDFDQTPIGRFLRWSLTYGRYIIVCTEIVVLLAFIYRFSLDRQITDLNEEIDQKSAIIVANAEFERQFRNLQRRTQYIGSLSANQPVVVGLLRHLETITPQGVQFTTYGFTEGKLTIGATASTNTHLALFLNNLKASEMLDNVNIVSLSKKGAGTSETTFQVEATIRPSQPLTAHQPEL